MGIFLITILDLCIGILILSMLVSLSIVLWVVVMELKRQIKDYRIAKTPFDIEEIL